MHDSTFNFKCNEAQSKVQAVTSSCDSRETLEVLPATSRAAVSYCRGRVHLWAKKHTEKTLERGKAKEPICVKIKGKICMEQPQQVRGDRLHPTGSAPPTAFHPRNNSETRQRKHFYLFFLL